jgi:hypothetical protein
VTTAASPQEAPAGSIVVIEAPEAPETIRGRRRVVIAAAGTPRDALVRMRRRKIGAAAYPVSIAEIDRLLVGE